MKRSAASSSWPVVVPGRAFEASIRRQRTRTSPAAAILSTCSGVLRMIILYTGKQDVNDLQVLFHPQRREQPPDPLADVSGRLGAVDPAQQALVLVVGDQRFRLLA